MRAKIILSRLFIALVNDTSQVLRRENVYIFIVKLTNEYLLDLMLIERVLDFSAPFRQEHDSCGSLPHVTAITRNT